MPLAEWLRSLGLESYAEVFERNDVDLGVLPSLSDADLQQLGLSLGHRRKLLRAIAELNGDATRSAGAAEASTIEGRSLATILRVCSTVFDGLFPSSIDISTILRLLIPPLSLSILK